MLRVFKMEALMVSVIGVAMGLPAGTGLGYWLTTFRILGLSLPFE